MPTLLGAMGVSTGGSPVVCTLPGASEWARCPPHPCESTALLDGEEAGASAAGEFPKLPLVSLFFHFFFLRNSSCSILLLHTRKGLSSHSPPLQLDWGLSGSGPLTAQFSILPSWHTWSLWVYHFILIPLPATSSNQVSLGAAQTFFGREGSH